MKQFKENGEVVDVALWARNPKGACILVTTHFDGPFLDDDQRQYVEEEIGPEYTLYVEEM